jgi:hypothetical protein
MKRLLILTALLATMAARPSGWVVVPNELADVEGNAAQLAPFTGPDTPGPGGEFWDSERYQQVYDASQFATVRPEGEFVTAIDFRVDAPLGYPSGVLLRSMEVSLSTTARGPDNLSTNFAENVGPDATVVFRRGQYSAALGYTPFESPQGFDMSIIATPWFFYRPLSGNLLLDIKVFTYSNSIRAAPFDASDVTGDSISCLATTNVTSTTGRTFTQGLVTAFAIGTPLLQALQTNDMLTLYWWQGIEGFTLQSTTNVGPEANWTPVPQPVTVSGQTRIVEVPIQPNIVGSYFRLKWTPPPGKALPAGIGDRPLVSPIPVP